MSRSLQPSVCSERLWATCWVASPSHTPRPIRRRGSSNPLQLVRRIWSKQLVRETREQAMIRYATSVVLLAALLLATETAAGETPAPRPPIGPKAQEMLPDAGDPFTQAPQPLRDDRIRIVNMGDQRLFIAYWNGESAWQLVAIDSGRTANVLCAKCAGTITVAFHDGRENRSVKAKGGGTYMLRWSAQAGAWILTSSPSQ